MSRFLALPLLASLLFASAAEPHERDPARWSNQKLAGRLLGIAFAGTEVTPEVDRWVRERGVGSIVFYATNTSDPTAFAALATALARRAAVGDPPPLLGIDQEGGSVIRFGPAMIPSAMALAASGSPELARDAGRYVGCALRGAGVTMNFAPVLDLATASDSSDLGTRAISSDPGTVASAGTAYIEGLRDAGVLAVVKHFPGQGHASGDPHAGPSSVTRTKEEIEEEDLVPFRAAIAAGVEGVMTAHVTYPGWPGAGEETASLSAALIRGLLRKDLGFEGVVITDAINMAGLGETDPRKAAVGAVLAGADLVLTNGPRYADLAYNGLVEALENGTLPRGRAVEAARRVLAAQTKAARAGNGCRLDPAIPLRLARSAVTEIRRGAGSPAGGVFAGSPGSIADSFSPAKRIILPVLPSAPQIESLAREIANREAPVVAAVQNRRQAAILARALALRPELDLTLVLLGSPADATGIAARRYVFAYGFHDVSQTTALEVLRGTRCAPGLLPVAVPGVGEMGSGDPKCRATGDRIKDECSRLSSEARVFP